MCASFLSHLSRSLADRWGTTVDFTTSFLLSLRFWAFRNSIFHSRPVHSLSIYLSIYLSCSLADRWGTTVDFTTSLLHSSRFLAFCSSIFHSRPVHSLMWSSHRFLCLPLRLPPWTVPCGIVLASPDDRVTCPYYFSLHLFTEVRRSSYGPTAFPILAFTSSLVMWSLYEIPRSLRKHLISSACNLLSIPALLLLGLIVLEDMVHTGRWTQVPACGWPGSTSSALSFVCLLVA